MSIPSSSDAVATTARRSPFLSRFSVSKRMSLREAAVVRQHDALAQARREREGDLLAHPARAHEHERGLVREHERRHAVVDLAPHLAARDRTQLVARHLDRERHLAPVSDVDDVRGAAEEVRDFLDRPHGRREADALRFRAAVAHDQIVEPRERQREMRAALVARQRVDFIDDDRFDVGEQRARFGGGEQDVERFGRRDQHVRRLAQHARAFRLRACRRCASRCGSRRARCSTSAARSSSSPSGVSRFLRTSLVSALSGET